MTFSAEAQYLKQIEVAPPRAPCFGIPPTFLFLITPSLLTTQSANHRSDPTPQYANEETEVQKGEAIHWRRAGRFFQGHVPWPGRDGSRNSEVK
jgi:hypothetical protein